MRVSDLQNWGIITFPSSSVIFESNLTLNSNSQSIVPVVHHKIVANMSIIGSAVAPPSTPECKSGLSLDI